MTREIGEPAREVQRNVAHDPDGIEQQDARDVEERVDERNGQRIDLELNALSEAVDLPDAAGLGVP